MTTFFKSLGGVGLAALFGVMLFGAAGAFTASDVEAQSPPAPPARFTGEVTIDGEQAPAGTTVEAIIDGANCGVTSVDSSGRYQVDVQALEPNAPDCGAEGSTVSFMVGGEMAQETGPWINYELNQLDLSVVSPTETPTETPTGTPDDEDDGTATPTPRGPDTGSGISAAGGTSIVWLFAAMGLGAAAFGVAGAAAARRS